MKVRVIFMVAITIFLLSSGCTNTSLNITENRTNNVANTQISPETNTNSIGMEFVLIPAGEFYMGSNDSPGGQPSHKVTIEKEYYLGKYEVTQAQWIQIMGSNPSEYEGDHLPVDSVSWNDAQEFVKKLNAKEGTNKYRLPSEAEWEYACRAGTTTNYSFGDNASKLSEYAWYSGYAPMRSITKARVKL
jgi:formylglycine-generating enzyme required for sulfatase activity